MDLGRIGTAMVTPFDEEGKLSLAKTTQLVEFLIENGTDSLIITGTTGESPTLSLDEKLSLYEHVVKVVNKRIPVIAGTGGNNTAASIELTQKAEALGVDGIMLVVPYYNKPNQAGLYKHFETIANSTQLPIMLYNIPGRSAVNMEPETIINLSKIDNIVAVKEASGNLEAMAEIIENTSDSFSLYSGDDGVTLPVLSIGGKGVISVASHIIGNEMQEMIAAYYEGRNSDAANIHRRLLPIMKCLFIAPNPSPLKEALKMKGLDMGTVRLPLVSLSDAQKNNLEAILDKI